MTYEQAFSLNSNTPPQAVNLEESVLGALMLDQAALINAIESLHVEYFYKPEHQAIYRAIRKLFEQSQPVDMLTVVERLRLDGELEAAGGAYAVSKLTENVVSAAHIEYHIRVLSEKYIQREMIRISTETITEAYDETTDVVNLLDKTETKLMDINDKNFRSDYHPVSDFVDGHGSDRRGWPEGRRPERLGERLHGFGSHYGRFPTWHADYSGGASGYG